MSSQPIPVDNLAKALAILVVEEESYSYIDKIGYAPSKDLALFYIKEALRDLHSLIRGGVLEKAEAKKLLGEVDFDRVEREIEKIGSLETRKELREVLSMLTSKALTIVAKAMVKGGEEHE